MSTGADEWITRKQAAGLAGCSEDSIKRIQTQEKLPSHTDATGRVLLNVNDLMRVGRIDPDALLGGSPAENAELRRIRTANTELTAAAARGAGRLEEHDRMAAALQQHNRELTRQLAQKDTQLRRMQDLLQQVTGLVPAPAPVAAAAAKSAS